MKEFPSPNCPLIIGNLSVLYQNRSEICTTLRKFAKDFYPYYTFRVLFFTSLNILSPEDCEIFLGGKKHTTKSDIYLVIKTWLKDGLLLSKDEKWLQRRRILTPAFHFNILKNFLEIFNNETENLLKIISKSYEKPLNVVPLVSEFALASINETAMGYKLNQNDKKNVEYRNAIYRIADIFIERLATPFHWFRLTYYFSKNGKEHRKLLNILHNFTKNIIKERMKNFKLISGVYNKIIDDDDDVYTMKKNKRRLAMLDILLQAKEDGEQIDYDGICEEVDTFMFEGHDTTAAALAFCLMLIANHPEIQEEIYLEIKNILNDDIKPTYKQLQEMDLLERVIKESLRLYPSVHFISRKVEEDTKLNSGLIVPKNTIINFHIFDIHRNPKIYKNPEKFNPDRFLPENIKNRHPFAYIPFSAGPRNCIGQKFAMLEMKSILTGIILNYKLKAIDTPDTIILEVDMILRSKDGIKVKFNPRKIQEN